MKEKVIVTLWMKGNIVKAVFSDNGKLFMKKCSTPEEAKSSFDTIRKMLSERGNVIKIKENED